MSEGNNCIAKLNLEVLPLTKLNKGLVQFLFVKSVFFFLNVLSDDKK